MVYGGSFVIKIVNANGLNMRKGPGTNYSVITVLVRDAEIDVISESNGWSKIKYNNQVGYVSTQYLVDKTISVSSDLAKKAIDIAKSKLGCAYVWGAQGPNTFDCSGLMYYIFKVVLNINLPRVSKNQMNYGKYIARNDLKPGDLIFFDTVGLNNGDVTHVGMYLGNNEFIEASSGDTMKVVISKLEGYYDKQYVTSRRIV